MRAIPNDFEQSILDHNRSLAPQNGTAFHEAEDLQAFLSTPPDLYVPGPLVVARLCSLEAVATISGAFGVGKNGAKEAAVAQAEMPHPRHNVSPIHPVRSGTTRLPEFRDGRVEDDENYSFAFAYVPNRHLAQMLRERTLVQFAQPRGDHVYYTALEDFPESGIALLDTVPSTLHHLNRILQSSGKQAIGMHRTVDSYDEWMARIKGRGDIFDSYGKPIDMENYNKRMREARSSLEEAMDLRAELGIKFFAAEERPEAGKAVIDILTGYHTEEAQKRGELGAIAMIRGLEDAGFKAA